MMNKRGYGSPHHDDYNLNLHNVNENTFIKWLLYARVVYTNNKAEQKSLT